MAFLTAFLPLWTQIELEEQRRSSRGRSKDKRKRKSHRNECGDKGAQPSPESKKTCPTSYSHSVQSPVTLHPEVNGCFFFFGGSQSRLTLTPRSFHLL